MQCFPNTCFCSEEAGAATFLGFAKMFLESRQKTSKTFVKKFNY